ncbi:hypothetical protein PHYPSEUDO_009412 [Phytophthora pseudosyringae]|uniref:Uncharacterized protein n=1 Tax=Phytophthora pseudosyringae TaxID=221518 RepID=A0A8T1VD44_9STRA|nr:hypothetical protein PHYPSEUDO_009412 [Phytophthora pseudosyringae]
MEETWHFLMPWCEALNKRLDYTQLEFEAGPRDVQKRRLAVTLPMRKFCCDEESFRTKFQQVREALQLLSAVAHVDQTAWKTLLSTHCSVDLGKEGGEKFEEQIPARFLLIMDLEERQRDENREAFDSDLVQLCGVRQRETQSEAFLAAIETIAGLDGTLRDDKPGVDVAIPVRVMYRARQLFSTIGDRPVVELIKSARAERVIKTEWDAYKRSSKTQNVEPGFLRCTFVLEPAIADFSNLSVRAELTETLSTLVTKNVWFSRVTLYLRIDSTLKSDRLLAKKSFGQLVTIVFDSTRRSPVFSNTKYWSELHERGPLQLGTVVLYCDPSLTSSEFEALCSAMVASQTTKRLSLSLWLDPKDANNSATRWKWLAYALFSKQARASSALESLTLSSIGSMSIADMEAFATVLTAEHPEEELSGTSRGQVDERKAMLKHEARVCYHCGEEGRTLVFQLPIVSVRTFSDDGQSEWVNAIVPGYGGCLVRRDDLEFEQVFEGIKRGITSLTIGFSNFNAQAMDGLGKFVSVVGPSLEILALDATRIDFDVNYILQCCPKLKELSLRSLVVDVRFNFNEWHESNQELPALDTDWTDAEAVAVELQDSCSLFTKSVRRLRVRLNNVRDAREVHDEVRIKEGVVGLRQMLNVNQTLEYLDVVATSDYHRVMDDFRMCHLKTINRSLSFPTESKAAFLSIFSGSAVTSDKLVSGSVSFQLDQHVLYKIFQLAAPPVLRQVYFRELDWVDKYNEVPI